MLLARRLSSRPMKLTDAPHEPSIFELRRTARRRAWVCPGAGFGLLGYRRLALLTFWSGLAAMTSALWLAWSPSRTAFYWLLGLVALSGGTWLWEIWTTYFGWPTTSGVTSDRRYRLGGGLVAFLTLLVILIVLANYGVVSVEGDGMAPKIHPGERLLYLAEVRRADLDRGRIILFKLDPESKFGEPGTFVVARILAVPGDRLSMQNGMYYVNDAAEAQIATSHENLISLNIEIAPRQTTVPNDCYFVVQDSPDGGHDGRTFSWVRRRNIVSGRFWSLSRIPPLKPIE